jgi:hypothetical protein
MKANRLAYILFCLAILSSCRQGRPARKELPPSLTLLPEIGANVTPYPSRWSLNSATSSDYLFYSTDTSLLIDGIRHDFLVLSLPDPTRDSTIGALIAAGQSLAPYLLRELHQKNKAGIVIDLRLSNNSPTIRQDYLITSTDLKETNLPIIFLSDNETSGRAAFFTEYLTTFPGVSWSITNDRPRYQSDCFKEVHPSF